MIKVLFVQSTLEKGGITNHLKSILYHLDRSKFEPVVLCLSKEKSNSDWQAIAGLDVQIHQINTSRWESTAHVIKKINNELLVIQPHLIQTFTFRPSYYIGKYFSNQFKTLGVLSSNVIENYKDTYGKIIGKYIANKELKGLSMMHQTIAVANYLLHVFPALKLKAIQNGVPLAIESQFDYLQKAKFKQTLNWKPNENYFVVIGALRKLKNVGFIIDAFLQSNQSEQSNLVIVGAGPQQLHLQKKYHSYTRILFVGQQQNVHNYLMAADAFVSASLSEGMPLSVLEAMTFELPCFLSQIPAHQELQCEANNASGIQLFDLKDQQQLVQLFNHFSPFQHSYTFQTAVQMTQAYQKIYQEIYLNNAAQ